MTTFVVPTEQTVTSLLQMLYGNDLSSGDCSVDDVSSYRTSTFVDDDNNLVAVLICDIQFAVYSGAALSMIPSGGADDMIAENDVSKTVLDNYHEVMNICSKLLMTDTGAHLRLGKVFDTAEEAGSDSIQAIATKVGFEVDIPGYGKGKIAAIVT